MLKTPANIKVYSFFEQFPNVYFSFKDLINELKDTNLSRYTILDAVGDLIKAGHVSCQSLNNGVPHYRWETSINKKKIKLKLNFHAGSNI